MEWKWYHRVIAGLAVLAMVALIAWANNEWPPTGVHPSVEEPVWNR